jgi:DNA repair exonuclease SbcCD nuclease subunit
MQGDKQAILISHFGLDEAQLASGISIRAGISARDLTMFKLVVLGHYHTPQNLKCYETEIHYTGSPIPVRRDEAGEEKRFLVVDTDTLEVTSVPTEGYRRYIELVLDEDTDLKEFTEQIELYKRLNYFVIIKKNIANVPSELKECMETTQVIDNFEKDPTLRGITSGMSPEEQCKKYLEIIMMPEEEWEEYVKIAMEIITEAEEVT